jgi:hypothetical protein
VREEDIRCHIPHSCTDCHEETKCDCHKDQWEDSCRCAEFEDEKDMPGKCQVMSFGSLYSPCPRPCIYEDIDFTTAGPSYGLGVSVQDNSFTIYKDGVYSISYALTLELKKCRHVSKGFGVYVNGNLVDISIVEQALHPQREPKPGIQDIATAGKTIQLYLHRGDIVTLAFTDCPIEDLVSYRNAAFTIAQLI